MPVLPEYNLADQVAILATAGSEEAPFLAQALAEAGATLFVIARRQDHLDAALSGLATVTGKHNGIVTDLSFSDSVIQAMKAFDLLHPQVDILVNDGRSMFARPFTEISVDEWEAVQGRNLRAAFLMCQQAGERMIQRQYGRIVNLISVVAERGMINGSAFSVSQAGALALTRSLAVEWGRHNIRVNALGVGWFTAEDLPPEAQQQELLVRYTPLRRKGHPRDIAPLLVYLCSAACDYSAGQPVYVDGGLNAHP